MQEPSYSIKEMLDVKFGGLDGKLDNIHSILKDQNINSKESFTKIDLRLSDIEKEQERIKVETARYQVIWGIGAAIGATLISIVANRIF